PNRRIDPTRAHAERLAGRQNSRSDPEATPRRPSHEMTEDQLRQSLEFYQDLGIKHLYRRPAQATAVHVDAVAPAAAPEHFQEPAIHNAEPALPPTPPVLSLAPPHD